MEKLTNLDRLAEEILGLIPTETVIIAEFDGDSIDYRAGAGKHTGAIVGKRGDIATSGLCTVVYQGSCPVVVGQTLGDNRIRQDIAVALGIKTALAVPIRVNNRLFGAVMVLNRLDAGELTDRDSLLVEEYLNSLLRDEG
jgi:GAF domain-containing protein